MKTATRVWLADRVEIRVIWAPAFLATKLDAFASRGRGDLLSSHDLEDILNVVDGRLSIVDELHTASDALQQFVRGQIGNLLSQSNLENYLPGLLTDGNRVGVVLSRLRQIAA